MKQPSPIKILCYISLFAFRQPKTIKKKKKIQYLGAIQTPNLLAEPIFEQGKRMQVMRGRKKRRKKKSQNGDNET